GGHDRERAEAQHGAGAARQDRPGAVEEVEDRHRRQRDRQRRQLARRPAITGAHLGPAAGAPAADRVVRWGAHGGAGVDPRFGAQPGVVGPGTGVLGRDPTPRLVGARPGTHRSPFRSEWVLRFTGHAATPRRPPPPLLPVAGTATHPPPPGRKTGLMEGYDATTYGERWADVYDDWYDDPAEVDATVSF